MEYNFILKYQIDHGEDAGDSIAERLGGVGVTMPCWAWDSRAALPLTFVAKQSQLKKRFYRHCQMLRQHSLKLS